MGRSPCCAKEGLNRGAWTAMEDKALTDYISIHGEGRWRGLPKRAGLKRCGKSCRLRWLNYLRPDIKRGNISGDEEELIIRLHKLLGNRWSLIAGRLPGRTDNEIKNYWNTNLSKKVQDERRLSKRREYQNKSLIPNQAIRPQNPVSSVAIRTKAVKCTGRVFIRPLPPPPPKEPPLISPEIKVPPTMIIDSDSNADSFVMPEGLLDFPEPDFSMMGELSFSEFLESQHMLDICCDLSHGTSNEGGPFSPSSPAMEEPIVFTEEMMDDWRRSGCGLDVAAGVELWLGD
ncbi:hypothetical protein V2J09_012366 [Rumex salicifolius]